MWGEKGGRDDLQLGFPLCDVFVFVFSSSPIIPPVCEHPRASCFLFIPSFGNRDPPPSVAVLGLVGIKRDAKKRFGGHNPDSEASPPVPLIIVSFLSFPWKVSQIIAYHGPHTWPTVISLAQPYLFYPFPPAVKEVVDVTPHSQSRRISQMRYPMTMFLFGSDWTIPFCLLSQFSDNCSGLFRFPFFHQSCQTC